MLDTVSYQVRTLGSRLDVRGVQVGRFAVRQSEPGTGGFDATNPRGGRFPIRRFVVEHIPSGIQAGHFDDFRDAMIFADDVSRFSAQDPAGTDAADVIAQMGPAVYDWLQACHQSGIAIPFRQWRAQRIAA